MKSQNEIRQFMVDRISSITGIAREKVSCTEPLYNLGLDSLALMAVTAELETFLGAPVNSQQLFSDSNIQAIAQRLGNASHDG